jgi:hypothetical protein
MFLYTVMVLAPLSLGTWLERNRDRFWRAAMIAIILHGTVLYSIRNLFPFRSILTIVPIALLEASGLFMLMLWVVGKNNAQPE